MRASSGCEGLQRLAEVHPDLVLPDVMIQELDGQALCRVMRADPTYRAVLVVLMNAVPAQISSAECDYTALIPQPFDLEFLMTTITRALNERAMD